MKTLVVGDIHGRFDVVKEVLEWNQPTVFVGDILDSFDRSPVECFQSLELVLKAVLERDNVQCVLGNHDLQYIDGRMRCKGYSTVTDMLLLSDFRGRNWKYWMQDLMVPYVWCEGFLISHAGISNQLLRHENITLDQYLTNGEFLQIGSARGGFSLIGGLYWCDWYKEFEPIPNVPQIVGHSYPRNGESGIRRKGNSFCIDVLNEGKESDGVIEYTIAEIEKGLLTEKKIYTIASRERK